MTFEQCPGCGHHYGRHMSSTPNEHGYCHWCQEEGVHDKASQAAHDAKWAAYHAQRRQEEAEAARERQEEEAGYGFY